LTPLSQFSSNQPVQEVKENPTDLVRFVSNCVQESERNRNRFALFTGSWKQDADKCDELYNGQLYKNHGGQPHECKPDDYAYYVDFDCTLLRQFSWKAQIRSVDNGENQDAKQSLDAISWTRLLEECFRRSNYDDTEKDMLILRGCHGIGIYEFQPIEEEGLPWPSHETFHPKYFGISPGASNPSNAFYCFRREPVPLAELKAKFPNKAKELKGDPDITIENTNGSQDKSGMSTYFPNISNGVTVLGDYISELFSSDNKVYQTWLTKFYFRDPQTIFIEDEAKLKEWMDFNPGFGAEQFKKKTFQSYAMKLQNEGKLEVKKYPFGRLLLTANKTLLMDVPNPYYKIPFIPTKCYRRAKETWAKGVIHKVREPIKNKMLVDSGCAKHVTTRLDPPYYATGNGPNIQKLSKIPAKNNTVTYLGTTGEVKAFPSQLVLPSDVLNLANYRKNQAETTAGLEAVLGGVNQTGTYSGQQFEKQLEQALGKVAPRYLELVNSRNELGEFYFWFIRNYMTDERKFDFMTAGEEQEYKQIIINQMRMVGDTAQITNDVTQGNFQYYIEIGLNKPLTKAESARQVDLAAERIAPFDPQLAVKIQLENMDFPGKYEILKQFKESVAAMGVKQANENAQKLMIEKAKLAAQQNKDERTLDVAEVEATSKLQESNSWQLTNLLTGLKNAGFEIPVNVLNQILMEVGIVAQKATQEVQGDAPGQ
jgi:hypothetical protein